MYQLLKRISFHHLLTLFAFSFSTMAAMPSMAQECLKTSVELVWKNSPSTDCDGFMSEQNYQFRMCESGYSSIVGADGSVKPIFKLEGRGWMARADHLDYDANKVTTEVVVVSADLTKVTLTATRSNLNGSEQENTLLCDGILTELVK